MGLAEQIKNDIVNIYNLRDALMRDMIRIRDEINSNRCYVWEENHE